MKGRHHLDPATLVSRAAGALSPETIAVVDTHLEGCSACRQQLATAEHVGGILLAQQRPSIDTERLHHRRDALRDRLGLHTMRRCNPATEVSSFRDTPNPLPRPLWPYFCKDWSMLRWRWVAPGVHLIRAPAPSGARLILLKIAPGKSMPMHGHTGSELTQVLQGAYHDVMGQFAAGDIADLGNDVEHQPIASIDRPCICVSVLDGPLRFHGWVARALQYWTGL